MHTLIGRIERAARSGATLTLATPEGYDTTTWGETHAAARSLAAVLQAPGTQGTLHYARATLGCTLAGALLAARHVWLPGAGGAIPVCPVPIGRVFEQSWSEAARQLLLGGPECSSLTWSFLDLTLPEWSLLAFLLLAVPPLSCLLAYRFRTLARS